MTGKIQGDLRSRARTTTALATIALVAGGYLVMSGTSASPAAAASSNAAGKGGMLSAGSTSSNAAGKGGMLGATATNSNKAGKGGMLGAAGTSSNSTGKGGKLTAAGESGGAAGDDHEYIVKYNTVVTSTNVPEGVTKVDGAEDAFRPGAQLGTDYDAQGQVDIYGAKSKVEPPRPPIEIGRQQYTSGEYAESSTLLGELNPLLPGLAVYGDWRTAVAYNQNAGNDVAQLATRLNIDVDFKLTGTERIHAFFTPLQDNAQFTRFEFGGGAGDGDLSIELDPNPQTLFFEGDAGALYSGFSGEQATFDLPFTVGLFPLFLQNGIWANDAILGGAFTIPAQNSAALGLSNFDVTFFGAFDNVDNAGVVADVASQNNNIANLFGVTTFVDAFDGYIEAGYGLIDGADEQEGLLEHYVTAAYTRRYYNTISNSTRVFANFGEYEGEDGDGLAIISENSLITGLPSTLLPYANFFVGFGQPKPLVDGNGAGILKNVGINFETDALTGFPKLDDTGFDTYGGAIGLQYLFNLDQQLVFEVATVQAHGDQAVIDDAQYGFGVRYQIPIDRAWLFRADATYQFLEGEDEDNFGIRTEIRRKF